MYFARREFGKVARVYELLEDRTAPDFGIFIPKLGAEAAGKASGLCGTGCWATGLTSRQALSTLHLNEDAAMDEVFHRLCEGKR